MDYSSVSNFLFSLSFFRNPRARPEVNVENTFSTLLLAVCCAQSLKIKLIMIEHYHWLKICVKVSNIFSKSQF